MSHRPSLGRFPFGLVLPDLSLAYTAGSATTVRPVVAMSDPGSVRYSLGGGLLTVANDLVVFVAPGGPAAEEWSELAQSPATVAELGLAISSDLPSGHHIALVQLADDGVAMLFEPGTERIRMRVVRETDGRIRFGMHPASTSSLWVGSGVVGASGFEISGFSLVSVQSEVVTDESEPVLPPTSLPQNGHPLSAAPSTAVSMHESVIGADPAPPPPEGEPLVAIGPSSPRAESPFAGTVLDQASLDQTASDLTSFDQARIDQTPFDPHAQPPPPSLDSAPFSYESPGSEPFDPPVVATSLFPDVPIETEVPPQEARPPAIERVPTPPPPGLPAVSERRAATVMLRFDDGQEVPLDATMAIGRAPEGSEHVPSGAVVVVISGEQVSRCHFVIRPGPDGAEVTDTNSLNGCFLDYPDRLGAGPQIPVGVPVPVEHGQQLRFGDRSLTVLRLLN